MEQLQQGFSDLTPMAGSDRFQNSAKSLLYTLKLIIISISHISNEIMGLDLTLFKLQENFI